MARAKTCSHLDQIKDVEPNTPDGCEECLAIGDEWVHLRLCMSCGHVGCCDQSPNRHASKHAKKVGHPVIRSFEPGEDWFWNFDTDDYYDGPELTTPQSRPADETVPGPRGRVPDDWMAQLEARDD